MFKEIKTIPLATFMSRLGHEPVRRCGDKLWYKSPLRHEHTPSFKVETILNCWYDFGIGKGGNIIDLASEIYQSTDIASSPALHRRQLPGAIGADSRCHIRYATLCSEF